MGEEVGTSEGAIPQKAGSNAPKDIPEGVMMKLARMSGLEYKGGAREGGGGLCLGIEGVRPRRRALSILGELVERTGVGSTDEAIKAGGSSWLEVMVWREDPEYAALWAAADRLRDTMMAARTKDRVWDCSLNGYDAQEAKSVAGVIEMVTVRKYDNMLALQILKGVGHIGKDAARPGKGVPKKGVGSEKPEPGVDGAPVEAERAGENVDTVLFPDRATAFRVMGGKVAGKG